MSTIRSETRHDAQVTLAPVDELTITMLVDNVVDQMLPDQGPVRRAPLVGPGMPYTASRVLEHGDAVDALRAEHGFSALVTVRRGQAISQVLYDAGLTPDGLIANMRRLGLDPRDVDVVVLSHGHPDHVTGLDGFVRALGRSDVPLIVHPDLWRRRRVTIPGRDPLELPVPSRRGLADAGFDLVDRAVPSLLFDGSVLVSGEVERRTPFETGFPGHETERHGIWTPDPFILDDQALVIEVVGRGLVVLTGCGHAGVINIVEHARRLTGVRTIHAVIGGFHLAGPTFEAAIPDTVRQLSAYQPALVVPAHCTGWQATRTLADALPESLVPNSVGTRITIAA